MKKWFIIMLLASVVAFTIVGLWDSKPIIKDSVSFVLNPTFGRLLDWNLIFGFIIVIAILSFLLTLIQKYTTDQKTLKELRKEQKLLQEEMKKYKDNPEKISELSKKQLEFVPKTFELTSMSILYTIVPLILLFKWFGDLLQPVWGGWWILWYLIGFMIFSSIFRKILKVY